MDTDTHECGFLEKLLDGAEVEWVPLGKVTQYKQPTKYLVTSKNYNDEFATPVLTAGKTFILGYTDEEHGIYKASESPVIIFDDFTTANKWVDFDFKSKSSAMKMITADDESNVLLKYVFYWMNTQPSGLVDGDHKRQWIGTFSKKKIPIPCPENPEKSLAIQAEIVRILDTFTELTAELTARTKQYNYYRDQLLTFEEGEVEWKALGKVCGFKNGFAFKSSLFKETGLPIIRITNVDGKSINLSDVKYFQEADYKQDLSSYEVSKGDLLVAMSGATTGKIGYYPHDQIAYLNQRVGKFLPKPDALLNRYLYHYLLSQSEQMYVLAGGGAQPNLSSRALMDKLRVPVPFANDPEKSLAEQSRIVAILDKFDTLANSIREGLPREIELRQKQYEYYRDLLLNFPRMNHEKHERHENVFR